MGIVVDLARTLRLKLGIAVRVTMVLILDPLLPIIQEEAEVVLPLSLTHRVVEVAMQAVVEQEQPLEVGGIQQVLQEAQ
jgi:hypothetical protein